MNLQSVQFKDVRLGAVFFDPQSGKQFQKVDTLNSQGENAHGERVNAHGEAGSKNFTKKDMVQAHENSILS